MLRKRELQRINYMQSPSHKRPLMKIISKTMRKLYKKYDHEQCNYTAVIIDDLIFNKNTHLVSVFKDHMIYDYKDEFLKREYTKKESLERVPKFASFYKNYLKFFCKPLFKDLYLNEQIQEHGKNRAELFYNQNFRGKYEGDNLNQDIELNEENGNGNEDGSRLLIGKTIFNTSVKENIDNNPIITNNNSLSKIKKWISDKDNEVNREETQTSITLNHDTDINNSGLLSPYSNEQSLISIMRQLKKRSNREHKTPQTQKHTAVINKKGNTSNNNMHNNQLVSPKNSIKTKSNIISYTKLCNEHLIKSNALKYIQKLNTKSQIQIKDISKTRSRNFSNKIEFKTYNPNNKKSLIKTQNIENIINRITQQVNSNLHTKKVYSIDNSNNSKKHVPIITYKTKSLCNLTKSIRRNSNKTLYPSNKIYSFHHLKLNSVNDLKHSMNHNNDLMKITLAFLMDNNANTNTNSNNNVNSTKKIKTSSHSNAHSSNSKFITTSKNIHNVNININNQININNNVHLNDGMSPKEMQIPSKLLKNDRVEVNIQSNLKKILNAARPGLSRNKEPEMFSSNKNNDNGSNNDNALWSNTINNNSRNKSKNTLFTSCSNMDRLNRRHFSRNTNTDNGDLMFNQFTKTATKTITSIPKAKGKPFSNQFVQGISHQHPSIKINHALSLNKLTKKY